MSFFLNWTFDWLFSTFDFFSIPTLFKSVLVVLFCFNVFMREQGAWGLLLIVHYLADVNPEIRRHLLAFPSSFM